MGWAYKLTAATTLATPPQLVEFNSAALRGGGVEQEFAQARAKVSPTAMLPLLNDLLSHAPSNTLRSAPVRFPAWLAPPS
jgi:hypothetical protein